MDIKLQWLTMYCCKIKKLPTKYSSSPVSEGFLMMITPCSILILSVKKGFSSGAPSFICKSAFDKI